MKKRTILWIGIPLLLLLGAAWAYHLYVKPHQSAAGETADFTVDGDSLYSQYQANEHIADAKFLGKVIEVRGKLSDIQHNGNAEVWILSQQGGGGGINCQLFAGVKPDPEPKTGDIVTLKGRCTGYLMDVNLVDCVMRK
jgi:RecJ-like exonuclease